MKKFIIIAIVFLFLPFLTPSVYVKAETGFEYGRIITDDTPFYSDADGVNLLFYLPYTYYVKIAEKGEILSHVEMYGENEIPLIDGYVPTEKLFFDGLKVKNPYPSVTLDTLDTSVLYRDRNFSSPVCYIFSQRTLNYVGRITDANGNFYYYVSYNNRLGYVSEDAVAPFTLPDHPNELTFIPSQETEQPTDETPSDTTADDFFSLKVSIVVCLAFAGLTALFIVLKKKDKRSVAISYYDENDYE